MFCGFCQFWTLQSSEEPSIGECRRFPRLPFFILKEWKWVYPLQFEQDLCGEFKKVETQVS
jgi:hypothetical protein